MSDKLTPAEAEKEFWKSLKESNTGMLGIDRPGYHHQPMTGFGEDETGTIWFFTRDDTDFARDVAGGGQNGMFCYQAKDGKVQACIHGRLAIDQDRSRIDKYWNPVVAAWYPAPAHVVGDAPSGTASGALSRADVQIDACPGRKPPVLAAKHPARPRKSGIERAFAVQDTDRPLARTVSQFRPSNPVAHVQPQLALVLPAVVPCATPLFWQASPSAPPEQAAGVSQLSPL